MSQDERNHEILRQRDAGLTYKAIAKLHGISTCRAQQIDGQFRRVLRARNRKTQFLADLRRQGKLWGYKGKPPAPAPAVVTPKLEIPRSTLPQGLSDEERREIANRVLSELGFPSVEEQLRELEEL